MNTQASMVSVSTPSRLVAPFLKGRPALDTEFRLACGQHQLPVVLALPRPGTICRINGVKTTLVSDIHSICSQVCAQSLSHVGLFVTP